MPSRHRYQVGDYKAARESAERMIALAKAHEMLPWIEREPLRPTRASQLRERARALRPGGGPGAAPPVLVAGERGTGKGIVAREIHALSRRASRAFIEVDCK